MFRKLIQATLLDYRNIWIKCSVVTNRVSDSQIDPGAIIGEGDRKRAPFLVLGLAPWYGTIFLFLNKLRHRLRHTRVHAARISCGCRSAKMASEICLWPTTHATPLWLLEFCLSIFTVSRSSLSGDSVEFRYVPLNIADQVESRCSFYKNCTLLQSKFHLLHKFLVRGFNKTLNGPNTWLRLSYCGFAALSSSKKIRNMAPKALK